ncbi:hypothetical protein B0H10DRAFT_756821 [Mycena sp. CBHHK59/15]|nr:hypothetical protein B0H10DRAFT_756821 [Mycena sp. CBHHK59/15]
MEQLCLRWLMSLLATYCPTGCPPRRCRDHLHRIRMFPRSWLFPGHHLVPGTLMRLRQMQLWIHLSIHVVRDVPKVTRNFTLKPNNVLFVLAKIEGKTVEASTRRVNEI